MEATMYCVYYVFYLFMNSSNSIIYSLNNISFVSISVLHQQSGSPVPPDENEQRSLAKQKCHSCGQCGKRFPTMFGLKIHQKFHTGKKPYGCDQCGQHFSTMFGLKIHQRFHTGKKLYGCEKCGQHADVFFSSMAHLKRHQQFHLTKEYLLLWGFLKCTYINQHISSTISKTISFPRHLN